MTFQTTLNLYAYNYEHRLAVCCKFKEEKRKDIVFSKDRLNWGKYELLKIWWIWKIEIWSEELVDGYHTVACQPGALIWGGQLYGSVSNPLIPLSTSNFTPIHVYPRLNIAWTAEYPSPPAPPPPPPPPPKKENLAGDMTPQKISCKGIGREKHNSCKLKKLVPPANTFLMARSFMKIGNTNKD